MTMLNSTVPGSGVAVAVGTVRGEADGVPGAERVVRAVDRNGRIPGKDGDALLGAGQVGSRLKMSARFDFDAIELEGMRFVEGENGVVAVVARVLQKRGGLRRAHDGGAPLRAFEQGGEGNFQAVRDLPQDRDGGVDIPALDLPEHAF